jgi:hypothetical protein
MPGGISLDLKLSNVGASRKYQPTIRQSFEGEINPLIARRGTRFVDARISAGRGQTLQSQRMKSRQAALVQ